GDERAHLGVIKRLRVQVQNLMAAVHQIFHDMASGLAGSTRKHDPLAQSILHSCMYDADVSEPGRARYGGGVSPAIALRHRVMSWPGSTLHYKLGPDKKSPPDKPAGLDPCLDGVRTGVTCR